VLAVAITVYKDPLANVTPEFQVDIRVCYGKCNAEHNFKKVLFFIRMICSDNASNILVTSDELTIAMFDLNNYNLMLLIRHIKHINRSNLKPNIPLIFLECNSIVL